MMELPAMIDIDGCKTIEELAHRVINEYEYNGKTIREWADLLTHPQTNADRIRAMSDEELAAFFAKQVYKRPVFDGWLPLCNYAMGPKMCHENGCKDCWLNWLREDVKET